MPLGVRDMLLVLRAKDQATRTILQVSSALKTVTGDQEKLARSSISTGSALIGLGTGLGIVGVAGIAAFGAATKAAIDYNKEAALTLTQVKGFEASLKQVEQVGINVAKAIPAPFKEMQASLYDIFSSTNANIAESEILLTAFAKGAVAGQVDIQASSNATIALMNAYKVPWVDVNKVMDLQFAIVRGGMITYDEFSSVIGRVIPSAVRAGQTMETLGGVMAFLTRNGLSAAMSATSAARGFDLLSNPKFAASLEELLDVQVAVDGKFRQFPDILADIRAKFGELNGAQKTLLLLKLGGEGSADAFAELGINIQDASGNTRDFADVSEELRAKFEGLNEVQVSEMLKDLTKGAGGTIQAMRFLNLAVSDNKNLLGELAGEVENASGAMDKAYTTMAETPAAKMQLLSNRYQILKVEIGNVFIPVLEKLQAIGFKLIDMWNGLGKETKRIVVIVMAVTSVILILSGIVLTAAGALMTLFGVLGLMGVSIGAVITAITTFLTVVSGIAVAIAGVILITKVFHINWKNVWEDVKEVAGEAWSVIQGVWDGITSYAVDAWHLLQPVWEGIREGYSIVKDAAGEAWQIIQSSWDGITDAFVTAWQMIQPIWQFMQDAWDLITKIAVEFWHTIQAVWNGVTTAISASWAVIKPILDLMYAVIQLLITIAMEIFSLWVTVVWTGISTAIQVMWDIIRPIWDLFMLGIKLIIAIAIELFEIWKNVVWDPLTAVLSHVWNDIIKPIFGEIVNLVTEHIIPALKTLWNVFVNEVWDPISTAVKIGWENVIKPAWESITKFINETLIPAIRTIKEVAGDVFDSFKNAAKAGFDGAANVIGAALSRIGGLVAGFLHVIANIAGAVGLDHIQGVLEEASQAASGWGGGSGKVGGGDFQALAAGGSVSPFVTNGIRAIVGEGNPAYPEYVLATDPKYGARNQALWAEYGQKQGLIPQFAGGGILGTLADAFSPVLDVAQWGWERVRELTAIGLEKMWQKFDVANNLGGIPPAAMNTIRQAVIDKIVEGAGAKGDAEKPVAGAIGSGQIGGGWEAITNWLSSVGEPYQITSTVRPGSITSSGNLSLHATGQAVDLVSDDMMRLFNRLLEIGSTLQELFYDPAGYSIKNGAAADFIVGGHSGHVHAATFDRGGILHPGWNRVFNATGAMEAVAPVMAGGGIMRNGLEPIFSTIAQINNAHPRAKLDAFDALWGSMLATRDPGGGLNTMKPYGLGSLQGTAAGMNLGNGAFSGGAGSSMTIHPGAIKIDIKLDGATTADVAGEIQNRMEAWSAEFLRQLRNRV